MRTCALCVVAFVASICWAEPTQEELEAASLLASRATFGMAYDQIVDIAEQGTDQWLDDQLNMECSLLRTWEDRILEMDENGEFDTFRELFDVRPRSESTYQIVRELGGFNTFWYMTVRYAPDQLCQRVAWALSQIFVVSSRSIGDSLYSRSGYYDILLRNAFGNYRELIEEITYSPQMGLFLSHVNNSRPRPEIRVFPDENYARELMQLFSIGLFELDTDGTIKRDESSAPIPSYDSNDIANLARVMTGMAYDGEHAHFNRTWGVTWDLPMMIFEWHHDTEEKVLFDEHTIPANQRGANDVDAALDLIFNHPNVGPFIGKQLIQRLVTSNPEPEYIQRVAEVFNDDGTGTRGNLKAVIKAVLTDPEAHAPSRPERFGKLREPIVRTMNMHRMFKTHVKGEDTRGLSEPFYVLRSWHMFDPGKQSPLDAPSVFNFYSPFHSPKGGLSDNGLVAPEFQIFDMQAAHDLNNEFYRRLRHDEHGNEGLGWFHDYDTYDEDGNQIPWHPVMVYDLSDYEELASSPADLVDRLDLVMSYGSLQNRTRTRFHSTSPSIFTYRNSLIEQRT